MGKRVDPEPKYRFELFFHDRETGKLIGKQTVEAMAQGQALLLIFKATLKYDPAKTYLVVKTDGCKKRPIFIIKNLRAQGIQVTEPPEYESGEKAPNLSRLAS